MKPQQIRLFIKPGCPWCIEAIEWFKASGLPYATLDVTNDSAARREMHDLSGQSKTPTVEVDGHVLADFGINEVEDWWQKMGFNS